MTLGERLRAQRKKKGMSLRDLSVASGVSTGHLCFIEKGKTPRPSAECLRDVAAALGISVDILMGSLARSADLTPAERKLLKRFRALDDDRKRDLMMICLLFAEEQGNAVEVKMRGGFAPSDLRSASRESRRLEELKEATAGSSEEVKW